ncbi:LPS assembly protein LptD [Siccirubricoccus sp. KC 17139]|uniref:LPS-assembly protein LptD n=1 Tax=Siccirubricoccus soli TaxID=2899147 RepID=A0ABT1DAB2_9PROT|nr:LPS assembly protein LptD [Siccirubricoccus soli]MCO6418868.1 LPS assembly protein LptD [Siccirubricoccus soli]MCP2685003.1 LPS assembly protein LptD [Siccirubricoccus soli]
MILRKLAVSAALAGFFCLPSGGPARAQIDAPSLTPRDPAPFSGPQPAPAPSRRAGRLGGGAEPSPEDSNAPVTFTAEEVEYDRERGVVTARGRVEAWQGERILRADEFTYDRNTGVATARGNVQLLEADGTVLFADTAELKDRFRDGVLTGVRALLAANARMAANGARRTGGTVNELGRVVYSSCDLCEDDPTAPPLWQVQARRAVQDKESQRITYRDATVRFFGVPLLYTPYLSHPEPGLPRASGFLFPTMGITRFLGAYVGFPYFWAIDDSQDLLVTPMFSARQYPNIGLEYRRMFNSGEITGSASIGGLSGKDNDGKEELAGHIFLKGRFALDEHWRAGFDLNRASSELYLRTFRYEYRRVLTSQAYTEGFWGTEGYARFDARAYQGLRTSDDTRQVPYVLPNLYYEMAPRGRVAGGFLTADISGLGIYREIGSFSQRLATRVSWERPELDNYGGLWTFKLQGDVLGYRARGQQESPTNLPEANGSRGVANIRAAVDWRMPFVRPAGEWGSQTIEPRVQFVTGPRMGPQREIPNEDSVDFEFTDANLFALNRFTGRDRQEGGTRVDTAIRAAWDFPNGGQVEGLVGRSFRLDDDIFSPYPGSGLDRRGSDYVARLRVAPTSWFEVLGRVRTDGERWTQRRLADTTATVSLGPVAVSAGYLYAPPVPYLLPTRSRDEVSLGVSARLGQYWRASAAGRYDLGIGRMVLLTGSVGYEDECFILEGRFLKRFAEDPTTNTTYPANTVVLVRIGLKTIGDYYLRAL